MKTHTPGPWTWDGGVGVDAEDGPGVGGAVADVADSHEGNGRLIAAAPDLLAAIVSILRDYDNQDPLGPEELTQLRALVAKATGAQEGR